MDDALITCAARRTSDNRVLKIQKLTVAVRYALVDVQGTQITRNVGESVARTQLERRESSFFLGRTSTYLLLVILIW